MTFLPSRSLRRTAASSKPTVGWLEYRVYTSSTLSEWTSMLAIASAGSCGDLEVVRVCFSSTRTDNVRYLFVVELAIYSAGGRTQTRFECHNLSQTTWVSEERVLLLTSKWPPWRSLLPLLIYHTPSWRQCINSALSDPKKFSVYQEVFLPFMRRAKSPQALIVIEAPKWSVLLEISLNEWSREMAPA